MNLHAQDLVAGWTAAQWVTVLRGVGVSPPFPTLAAAAEFRRNYLLAHDAPVAYHGKNLEVEMREASLILASASR